MPLQEPGGAGGGGGGAGSSFAMAATDFYSEVVYHDGGVTYVDFPFTPDTVVITHVGGLERHNINTRGMVECLPSTKDGAVYTQDTTKRIRVIPHRSVPHACSVTIPVFGGNALWINLLEIHPVRLMVQAYKFGE